MTGFYVRGGLATTEKTFIGFQVICEYSKLFYERIDASNLKQIQKNNDGSFKVFKNDVVFFVFKNGSYRGGKIVSFLEEKIIASFQNSRYPASIQYQPNIYCIIGKDKDGSPKKSSSKQYKNGKSTGIIKLNLDILGNIKSYNTIGAVSQEVINQILHKE